MKKLTTSANTLNANAVVGVDSPANLDSVVYAKEAKKLHLKYAQHNEHAVKRRSRLREIQVFKERKGYDILDHCNDPGGAPRSQCVPMFQTLGKGSGKQDQTLNKTMEVIFPDSAMRLQGKTSVEDRAEQFRRAYRTSKERMQQLRNEDTGGKSYNIITNAKQVPEPTCEEKMNKWMLHPSFQAIPKVRFR